MKRSGILLVGLIAALVVAVALGRHAAASAGTVTPDTELSARELGELVRLEPAEALQVRGRFCWPVESACRATTGVTDNAALCWRISQP